MAFWQNFPSIQSKLNATNLNNLAGGWTKVVETATYLNADAPTFTIRFTGDVGSFLSVGMKIKYTQTTIKFGIITAIGAFDGTYTDIKIYGGTDYTLTNTTISDVYFSVHKAPYSFPMDTDKWSVIFQNVTTYTQSSPVANTWYNFVSKEIPIGLWDLSDSGVVTGARTSAGDVSIFSTLSTTNNSSTDPRFNFQDYVGPVTAKLSTFKKDNPVNLTSKTIYYINIKTDVSGLASLKLEGANAPSIIKAVCAYI